MHELVHLVEGHHGPEFWQALGRAMPDWQKRKDALADKAKDYLMFGLILNSTKPVADQPALTATPKAPPSRMKIEN